MAEQQQLRTGVSPGQQRRAGYAMMDTTLELARRAALDPPVQVHLEHHGFVLGVSGNAACVRNLVEFYRPFYQFTDGHHPAPDASVFAYVDDSGPGAAKSLEAMILYLEPSSPMYETASYSVHERPNTGIVLLIEKDAPKYFLLGSNIDNMTLQLRTFVRDQILRQIERVEGQITFHSAAVERDNKVILFMGNRNAGKTSSLLAFLGRGDFNAVSPDRVKLHVRNGEIAVLGFPARCNVHRIAVENDAILQKIAARMPVTYDHEGKFLVPMEQIARTSGTRLVAGGDLGCIVLPNIDARANGIEILRCEDEEDITAELAANLMEGGPEDKHVHWLGAYDAGHDTINSALRAISRHVARNVPVYRVRATHSDYVGAIRDGSMPFIA